MKPRRRLRDVLPIVQMVLVLVALIANGQRGAKFAESGAVAPERVFAYAISAPVVPLVKLVIHAVDEGSRRWPRFPVGMVDYLLELTLLVGATGFLWYLIAVEMDSPGKKHLSVLTSRTKSRPFIDGILVLYGLGLGLIGVEIFHRLSVTPEAYAVSLPFFLWAAALVIFYGRDLLLYPTAGRCD